MDVCYNKLFKMLIDRELRKNRVCEESRNQCEYACKAISE